MKHFKSFLFALAGAALLTCCGKPSPDEPNPQQQDPDPVPVQNPVDEYGNARIVVKGVSPYSIVYSATASSSARADANALRDAIKTVTGAVLPVKADSEPAAGPEILVGRTSRAASGSFYSSFKQDYPYGYSRRGSDIVIGGSDDASTTFALFEFDHAILSNPLRSSAKSVMMQKRDTLNTALGSQLCLKHLMGRGHKYTIKPSLVGYSTQSPDGQIFVAQGACTDGQNVYFALRDNEVREGSNSRGVNCIVVKDELPSLKNVAVSDKFVGGHINSMTWCKGYIYAVQTNAPGLSKIDPVSLKEQAVQFLNASGKNQTVTAITYDAKQGKFMLRNGQTLYITDSNLKLIKTATRTDNTKYTTQGVGSDDTYCYFPVSPASGTDKTNRLLVYDWDGNFVDEVVIPLAIESEDMFSIGEHYYVNFADNSKRRHALYELLIDGYAYSH